MPTAGWTEARNTRMIQRLGGYGYSDGMAVVGTGDPNRLSKDVSKLQKLAKPNYFGK